MGCSDKHMKALIRGGQEWMWAHNYRDVRPRISKAEQDKFRQMATDAGYDRVRKALDDWVNADLRSRHNINPFKAKQLREEADAKTKVLKDIGKQFTDEYVRRSVTYIQNAKHLTKEQKLNAYQYINDQVHG